ncbi:O-acyltransferase like protein [Helicoverpa armigera]|uniref:O-acyltransferase like protein n=1 Tax=Helicoverpa armigera TaxID=29058 RepID=UPI003083168F
MFTWLLLTVLAVAAAGLQLNDEEYFSLPRLYSLDDWEACAARRGIYCLGAFELRPRNNPQLLHVARHFSEGPYQYNHTLIHRGLCLSTSCKHVPRTTPRETFSRCVNNLTIAQYGLSTNLTTLNYCSRPGSEGKPVDTWDMAFLYITGLILLMNVVGTAYHVFRVKDKEGETEKPNKQLMAWSVVASWQRLTADYGDNDPRLSALQPVHGVKALTLILVILAHSVVAYHGAYLYNPQYFEKVGPQAPAAFMQNGTSIVQTFMLISSFLLAYNLLLQSDNPKKQLSITMLPRCLMHRIARISPLYLFVLGAATSWWAQGGAGPLWPPLMLAEVARCRHKWWTQALFLDNFLQTHDKCLIHTWFLTVDMQLYVVSAILTLVLGRWPRAALRILLALTLCVVVANFAIIYNWQLKPMVLLMTPENMRTLFVGSRSFIWLYTAPWDSAPAALLGVALAFLLRSQHSDGYRPQDNLCIRILYRVSVPGLFAWVLAGHSMKAVAHPLAVSAFAAIDRPVFSCLVACALYGFFNKIDRLWWKFLSWRGWAVLSRMSLSIYLIHWLFTLTLLAQRTNTTRASAFDIGGHWLTTVFLSYCAALPLHLLIEVPAMKFLQSISP